MSWMLSDDEKTENPEKIATPSRIEDGLFNKRQVLIVGEINPKMARSVTERLLAMAAESDDPIDVFISSPGGHVESGDMIHDMIKFVKPTVRCIGTGWVASAGALIFVAAERQNRFCLPNTRFLLHQPSGGAGGIAADIAIQAEQIVQMHKRLNRIFAEATGQPIERIAKDTDRDYWMSPEQALDYGLLGSVIRTQDELPK